MKVVHIDGGEPGMINIRGNGGNGRMLLTGDEDTPDNYRLNFSRQDGEAYSPRHKHNFDQIRMVLGGGSANYGPKREINPGEIVYFPEGTPYGPQEGASQRYGLTLQFGGASGCGFIGRRRMYEGRDTLKQFGTFESGVFHRSGELQEGQRRNQDAYEAIWEFVGGRTITYPKQRYDEPIHMRPDNFEARPVAGQSGVSIKRLGTFSEREITVAMLYIAAGTEAKILPRGGRQLGFAVHGSGRIEGTDLRQHSTFELLREEGAGLVASSGIELLLIGLPIFSEYEIQRFQEERKAGRAVRSAA